MKRKAITLIACFAAGLIVLYVVSLKGQLQAVQANQENYKSKISSLTNVKESAALQQNKAFLKRFFNYDDTKERYDDIKPLMTDRGFQSTYPSGNKVPKKNTKVKTAATNLKAYEFKNSKTEAEYMNEFNLSTKFNGVANTDQVLVKTKLIYVEGQGWKVDEVEFVGQSGGSNRGKN